MAVRVPSYRLHKPSGRAVVTIAGKDHYLGEYGSVESHEAYGRLIAQNANGAIGITVKPGAIGLTVNEVVLAFLRHAKTHYVKDGQQTGEYQSFLSALRPLTKLYGETAVDSTAAAGHKDGFGPNRLRAVRDLMIQMKWSRRYINKSVSRIRQVFKYAVAHELVNSSIVERLRSLEPLLKGRCEAVELPERTAVDPKHIETVRRNVNQRTRDMIDLCLLTGCRPGELVSLTTGMIDRSGDVWTATLTDHKMKHKGKTRMLAFGPKAKLILRRYLLADTGARIFPIRRDSFSKTIVYWCKKLDIPVFTGHWLRHNAASDVRAEFDLDGAQSLMGHSDLRTTQRYAHLNDQKVVEIARKRG